MPRIPLHSLVWSEDHSLYELYTHGQFVQRFRPGDEEAWLIWLAEEEVIALQRRTEG
jgi:hypothetical protein